MAQSPDQVLQLLVDEARVLCNAGSAGISLLDDVCPAGEAPCFRWLATSGAFAPLAGNTMPRNFSPCGSVLDVGHTLLMSDPVRHFEYINVLPVPVREVLLVPFYRNEVAIGTVWIASHDEHKFDKEDARLVKSLSQFASAALQMNEANQDKGEFLVTLTHELRNVLAPMSNAVTIIKQSDEFAVRVKAREMLERQIQQLTRLIEDLLDTARIARGKLHLELAVIDFAKVVRNASEAAHDRVERSGQQLQVSVPDAPVWVRGDETRLAQVLGNLLTNAAKYGRPDGEVKVTLTADADEAKVSVRDFGVGISATMLPKIFNLFVQVDDSVAKSQGGLGIGLSVVHRLVAMHGGHVEARSEGADRGSEFIVTLPLSA